MSNKSVLSEEASDDLLHESLSGKTAPGSSGSPEASGDAPALAFLNREYLLSAAFLVPAILLTALFAFSYWPTLASMWHIWTTVPDYSGALVVPFLAAFALWQRQDSLPAEPLKFCWWGLSLIAAAMILRMAGGMFFIETFDGWSIVLWVAGLVWMLGGWQFFKWAAPAVAFLWFMVPLPHAVERGMKVPLQKVATKLSVFILQCLGQPAVAQGTTIQLGSQELGVEEACSGLRIFVTIVIIMFAYILILRPSWLERVVLIAALGPIALLTNATRIVATALVYSWTADEGWHQWAHDKAGLAMPFIAFGLVWLLVFYLGKLIREVDVVDFRHQHRAA